jgi:hypothetical protein
VFSVATLRSCDSFGCGGDHLRPGRSISIELFVETSAGQGESEAVLSGSFLEPVTSAFRTFYFQTSNL